MGSLVIGHVDHGDCNISYHTIGGDIMAFDIASNRWRRCRHCRGSVSQLGLGGLWRSHRCAGPQSGGARGDAHRRERDGTCPRCGGGVNDCKSGTCKTDVVLSPFGEPVLINKATGRPVEPAKVIDKQTFHQWSFELSPRCTRIWPGGEICK